MASGGRGDAGEPQRRMRSAAREPRRPTVPGVSGLTSDASADGRSLRGRAVVRAPQLRAARRRCSPTVQRALESYVPQTSRRAPQISPIVQRAERLRIGTSRFPCPGERPPRRAPCGASGPLGAHARGALALAPLGLGVDPVQLDVLIVVFERTG